MAAWHSDPEAAREYIRQHPEVLDTDSTKPGGKPTRSLSEWTPEVELLTTLTNEFRGFRSDYGYVSSQGKGSRKKPDLIPGPISALDKEIAAIRQDRLAPMRAKLVPNPPVRKD